MNSSAEDVRPWHPLVPYAHPIRYPTPPAGRMREGARRRAESITIWGGGRWGNSPCEPQATLYLRNWDFFFLGLFWNPLLYRQQDVRGDHTTPSSQIQDVLNVKSYEWALVIWFLIIIL